MLGLPAIRDLTSIAVILLGNTAAAKHLQNNESGHEVRRAKPDAAEYTA